MSGNEPVGAGGPPLSGAAVLGRLALIGVVLLVVAGLFAYVAGWLSPDRLTQDKVMNAFWQVNGDHPGFRRNHAKGVCVSGYFESNGNASTLSSAEVFRPGRVPVMGRLALAGGMPMQADSQTTVRSLALRFLPAGGGEWRTGMNSIPVFPVRSAQAFYEQLQASRPDPATGKPDPAAMKHFLTEHPESARAIDLIKVRKVTSGFTNSTYNSLDAFEFIDPAGHSTAVRWAAVPEEPETSESASQAASADKNYLFEELIAQVRQHPVRWHLIVTVGQAGDQTADATVAWPADRRQVDAGTVVIDGVSSEDGGACTDINFDPMVLPAGIEPSDDPLLSARSAAYARSFTLRTAEKANKAPSAVGAGETRPGTPPAATGTGQPTAAGQPTSTGGRS